MRRKFCFFCLGIFFFTFSETKSQQAEQIITNSINQLENALLRKDTLTLNNLLHSQLTLGHSNGWIESKESLKKDLLDSRVVYDFFMPVGEIVFHYLSDTLIITRRDVDVFGTYQDYNFVSCLNILEVWTWVDGNWLLTARQSVNKEY
jgi:hypothetical protein